MAEPEETIDDPSSADRPISPDSSDPTSTSSSPTAGVRSVGIFAVIVILITQVVLLGTMLATRSEVSDLRAELEAGTGLAVPNLGSGASSPGPSTPATTRASDVATRDLPRFLGSGGDAALGRNLGDISGLEYYSGEDTVLDSGDGTARAIMVWAHWCPYCQDELPVMAEWQTGNAADLGSFELVSITSAMDPTATNPLEPYLDSSQFPFPVLVDDDGSLAAQLGVNAFPFWVFVAPDGTVVGRAAGYIEGDALAAVFEQLNQMALEGPAAVPGPGR